MVDVVEGKVMAVELSGRDGGVLFVICVHAPHGGRGLECSGSVLGTSSNVRGCPQQTGSTPSNSGGGL